MNKKKILVADDERYYCEFFKDYFTMRGHEVDTAYDGAAARDLIESKDYDYVFFDFNMPELSGIELMEIISKKNPSTKKIMISAYDGMEGWFAKELGVDIFLSKPISLKDIEELIK